MKAIAFAAQFLFPQNAHGAPIVTPFSQASPVETGEGDRLRWKGRYEQAITLYRKKVTQATGAPIVTPAACHFPRLGRGKLICRNAKPPPCGTGEGNREAVEGAL